MNFPDVDLDVSPAVMNRVRSYLLNKYGKAVVMGLAAFPKDDWVILKRKGNRVRWHNRATGAVDPVWYALFVQVPTSVKLKGLTKDEFNILSRIQNWPGR